MKRDTQQGGFTLVEVAIVLAVVAVLVAGTLVWTKPYQLTGELREAEARLVRVIDAARGVRRLTGSFPTEPAAVSAYLDEKLVVVPGDQPSTGQVSYLGSSDPEEAGVAVRTRSGVCVYAHYRATGSNKGFGFGMMETPDEDDCRGEVALGVTTHPATSGADTHPIETVTGD